MFEAATLRICLSLALAVSFVSAVQAQTPDADSLSVPVATDVYKLELKSFPEIKHGRAAIVEGVVGRSGQKLAIGSLSVLQPVEVTLFTPDVSDDVRIELSKFIVEGPARTGSTKGQGVVSFKFRTQGDLQIKLVSAGVPTLYRLVLWVGDEVAPTMRNAFVSMDEYNRRQGTTGAAGATEAAGTPFALWIIAGALVMIGALLAVLVLKRGRS